MYYYSYFNFVFSRNIIFVRKRKKEDKNDSNIKIIDNTILIDIKCGEITNVNFIYYWWLEDEFILIFNNLLTYIKL